MSSSNYPTKGPGEGTWSVFAEKCMAERDAAQEEAAQWKRIAGMPDASRELMAQRDRMQQERDSARASADEWRARAEAADRGYGQSFEDERDEAHAKLTGEAAHIRSLEGLLVEATDRAERAEAALAALGAKR